MVDMSATLIHHGHVRLLKKASKMGKVIIALTSDDEIRKKKGYNPELSFSQRKEILNAFRYVDKVVKSKWLIEESFLDIHDIDILIHGDDNSNPISKERLVAVPRTPGVSSSILRERAKKIWSLLKN